jgi:hypothetical protein
MIGQQRPGIDAGLGGRWQLSQMLDKIFTIGDIVDNSSFFYPPHHLMIQTP